MTSIRYIGEDYFGCCIFKGDNGQFYKTTLLVPYGEFNQLPSEDQDRILQSLHTTTDPDGEPFYPCWDPTKFVLASGNES